MFKNLSDRLTQTLNQLTGRGRLTEDNIQESLRQIRIALLEADVALPVIKQFIEDVKQKALGQEVLKSLNPGQTLIKIVRDELIAIMGATNETLNLQAQPPAVILMAGLQGSGKTTTVAKLAHLLKTRDQKQVMVTSADIYRPAAIDQLESLAKQIDVNFFPSNNQQNPIAIVTAALDQARKQAMDVLIIDTAGRLHIDEELMKEIQQLHAAVQPIETLFVVDSMTGQDAAHTAQAFSNALPLTGVILTKADGDARGGAALSVRHITGKPIKFIGVGEKINALEPFFPDRIASRILGMGDVMGLIEQAEQKIDKQEAEKLTKKLQKGSFDLDDFRNQIQQMSKMGSMSDLLEKIPGASGLPMGNVDNKMFGRYTAMINSMTKQERRFPQIIKGSRKRRIATGSGCAIPELNRLLKQFEQMQHMMKKMSKKGGLQKMLRGMGGLAGMAGKLPFPLGGNK
jgi:signal recognition particle subunit SRP54